MSRPRVMAIIQARMGSRRLPGKALARIVGKPLLAYVLERLRRCRDLDQIVVATSNELADTAIYDFCQRHEVACVRGDHENVARRLVETLERLPCDAFVRVCGDSPLIDPQIIDMAVELYRTGRYDLVTNTQPRTFPTGQSVEVVQAQVLRDALGEMHAPEHFEHVTRFFYEHPRRFRIFNLAAEQKYDGVSLAVDTPEDLERMEKVIAGFDRPHWHYGLREILAHCGQPAGRR